MADPFTDRSICLVYGAFIHWQPVFFIPCLQQWSHLLIKLLQSELFPMGNLRLIPHHELFGEKSTAIEYDIDVLYPV